MMGGGANSIMSPQTEFGRMMQQAVAMKTEMLKSDRRTYERFPPYYQNTIFHDALLEVRKLPLLERLAHAEKLKEEGNSLFQANDLEKANSKYEEALSVFRYLYVKAGYEGWRKDGKGLRDEIFEQVDCCGLEGEHGASAATAAAIKQLKIVCYLNIAAVQLKVKGAGFAISVQACNSALELDPTNTKALYRRAQARLLPPSAGAHEQELALCDLAAAAKADPNNATVREELQKLRRQMSQQKNNDKQQFSGLFERGDLSDETNLKALAEGTAAEEKEHELWEQQVEMANRQIEDAEKIMQAYKKAGDLEKAEELSGWIAEAKTKISEQRRSRMLMRANFDEPTPEMIADAAANGIDLTDPAIREFVKRLAESQRAGVPLEQFEGGSRRQKLYRIGQQGIRLILPFFGAVVAMLMIANGARMLLRPYVIPPKTHEEEEAGEAFNLMRGMKMAANLVGVGHAEDDDEEL